MSRKSRGTVKAWEGVSGREGWWEVRERRVDMMNAHMEVPL
jgi:hypothetical protein